MKVSFIVPLYNCLPLTQAMLGSLQSTLPPGLAHEIIFVDDGSTDGTRDWLATLASPCRHLLNEKNTGFAGSCNRGAAGASGEYLFFLNNDLVLTSRWLEPMLAAFAQVPDLGLVGNVQLNARTGKVDHTGVIFGHRGVPKHDHAFATSLFQRAPEYKIVPAVTGACFGIRRSYWQELGGFDEIFVNGSEDIDLCLRSLTRGRKNCVAMRSVIHHHVSSSPGRKLKDERNAFLLVSRWRDLIAELALDAWCQRYVRFKVEPFSPLLACQILAYRLGLLRRAPVGARNAMIQAIDREITRWKEMGVA